MSNFYPPKSSIHFLSRGLLISDDKIIFCRVKGENYFFLPGGHIENGESAKAALLRELIEEIGGDDYKINSFIGICESVFVQESNLLKHEINIVFEVDLPSGFFASTKEDHIEFINIKKEDLEKYDILPVPLKEGIIEWLKNGKMFFKEL